MNFVKNKCKFIIIPIVLIIAGIVMFCVNGGFNFDVEFSGGTRMQVKIGQEYKNDEIKSLIKEKNNVDAIVQKAGNGDAIIKTPPIEEETKQAILNTLTEAYNLGEDALVSSRSAAPSFGKETQAKALMYTLIALLCILAYIAIRFEWRSAVMAVLALAINVLVMMAVYAICYIPLNTTFIAAMLTVVGYSINNTIVIFDRIRENMKSVGKSSITEGVDRSIKESMGRTINATITTLITIVLLYIIGVEAIKEFALPLIIGIIAGAYSSITMAAPFWATWKEAEKKAKAAKLQKGKKK